MHRLSAPAVRSLILLTLLSFTTTSCSHPAPPPAGDGEPLTVVMWNVESGGANIQSIAEKCCRFDGIDLLGLSEVQDKRWMDAIDAAPPAEAST